MRTRTKIREEHLPVALMDIAFEAIEHAVWHAKDCGEIEGPNRLMATALINHVWKQLEE